MNFLADYGLFLLKTITIVSAFLVVLLPLVLLSQREKQEKGKLEVVHLNEKYQELSRKLKQVILSKEEFKKILKEKKKKEKPASKNEKAKEKKKKIFLLKFQGDIKASETLGLTESINAVLQNATKEDEVILSLESPGGMVHAYGLAASQLSRIRSADIPLTVCVDKIAASGGYLMACVANKILAAPFAILGSIGVVAQLPNFHRFMEKHDIDYEQITAGEYKRTLTIFGKNTPEGRLKFQQEVEEIHALFKAFVQKNRPQINIEQVATGEHWLAEKAIEFKLVDELMTTETYLLKQLDQADIYEIRYCVKKSWSEKIGLFSQKLMEQLFANFRQKQSETEWV